MNLSSSGGSSPDMVVSADGTTAVAVWLKKKDGHRVVQSRTARIVDGVARWSPKQDLSRAGPAFASSPSVAVSGDGDTAIVMWTSRWLSVRARTAAISHGIASWSARQTVAPSGSGGVSASHVVMSRDGSTVVAAWYRGDDYTEVVQSRTARISHGTASWKETHDLSPAGGDSGSSTNAPQVGVSRDGSTAVAVWPGELGNVQSSTAGISNGVAAWATPQNVSPPGSSARLLQVALSADGGTAITVWAEQDADVIGHVIRARTAAVSGATADWGSGPDVLSGALAGYAPHVAISRDGTTAVAVWTATWSENGIGNGIAQSRAASINAGSTTWSDLQDLSPPVELTSVGSDVALSADGTRAVAVWSFGSVQSRRASLSARTATWKPTQRVSANGVGPLVGLSRDGRTAVSVWNRYDGTKALKRYLQSATAHAPQ